MKLWHYQGAHSKTCYCVSNIFKYFTNVIVFINKYLVCPSSDEKVMVQREQVFTVELE